MYRRTSQLIGQGSFSDVFEATAPNDSAKYAFKQLKAAAGASAAERFRREVEILADLDHHHIVGIVFTDLLAPRPYFVMPRAKQNLEIAVKFDTQRRLDIGRIFREICEATVYAHNRKVLHRDLKPQNILLTVECSVKVSDFGIARSLLFHRPGFTKSNDIGGTLPYAAPEQFDSSLRDVDERADIYSLGKILYFLYTKLDPYLIEASPFLPSGIYDLIKKATDGDRERRFQSVEALLSEFMRLIPSRTILEKAPHQSPSKKYVSVQLEAQKLASLAKSKKFVGHKEIEQIAIGMQRIMWLNRDLIWKDSLPDDPLEILDVEVAFDLLGFQVNRPETLGTFLFDNGEEYKVAGQIDQITRVVSISQQFDRQITRFTEAHELGHSLLHKQQILHRDRPLSRSNPTRDLRPEEYQADKFATYFLMPRKQMLAHFKAIFGTLKFEITPRTAEALIQADVDSLISAVRNRRGLARALADAHQFSGRHFHSLAELFNVSSGAMAIRLEELELVHFQANYR